MKLYRGDLDSVFAILIGGAISGVATLSLLVPEPAPRTVSVRGERAAYRVAIQRGLAPTQEMRALAERIGGLQSLQEEVRQRVAGFEVQGPDARADQLAELRRVKYSKATIEQWDAQSANHLEQNIEADILAVRERIVRSVGEPVRGRPVRRR